MVSKEEGQKLSGNGAIADADDHGWGAAWDEEETTQETPETATETTAEEPAAGEDDGTDAWGWGEEAASEEQVEESKDETADAEDEEDPSEAWGWGEDNQNEAPEPPLAQTKKSTPRPSAQKELLLKETYSISSMPEPVLRLIFAILEDGAALTQASYANSPVVAAAAGLFSLPTLVLAMFRAISPHYYALDMGGNM
jgi:centromere/kinetochore protein ZW10